MYTVTIHYSGGVSQHSGSPEGPWTNVRPLSEEIICPDCLDEVWIIEEGLARYYWYREHKMGFF